MVGSELLAVVPTKHGNPPYHFHFPCDDDNDDSSCRTDASTVKASNVSPEQQQLNQALPTLFRIICDKIPRQDQRDAFRVLIFGDNRVWEQQTDQGAWVSSRLKDYVRDISEADGNKIRDTINNTFPQIVTAAQKKHVAEQFAEQVRNAALRDGAGGGAQAANVHPAAQPNMPQIQLAAPAEDESSMEGSSTAGLSAAGLPTAGLSAAELSSTGIPPTGLPPTGLSTAGFSAAGLSVGGSSAEESSAGGSLGIPHLPKGGSVNSGHVLEFERDMIDKIGAQRSLGAQRRGEEERAKRSASDSGVETETKRTKKGTDPGDKTEA